MENIIILGLFGIVMLVTTLSLGRSGMEHRSLADFSFVPNRFSSLELGFSVFATCLSSVTFLGIPQEVISKGAAGLGGTLALPIIGLLVGRIFISKLKLFQTVTIYQAMGQRFGEATRKLAAWIYVLCRLIWMCCFMHFSSKALTVCLNISPNHWVLVSIAAGICAIAYSVAGGIRAVIRTDFIQASCMIFGSIITIVFVCHHVGLASMIPEAIPQHWETQPLWSWDFSVRSTYFGQVILTAIWVCCLVAGDQTTYQRFACRPKDAQKIWGATVGAMFILQILLTLTAFAVLTYLRAESLELNSTSFSEFIGKHAPPWVAALLIFGVAGATLSSFDSGINSLSVVALNDLCPDKWQKAAKKPVFVRGFGIFIGVIALLGAYSVHFLSGTIIEITTKLTMALHVPNLVLFLAATHFKPKYSATAYSAVILTTIVGIISVIAQSLEWLPLSYMWLSFLGFIPGLSVLAFEPLISRYLQTVKSLHSKPRWL